MKQVKIEKSVLLVCLAMMIYYFIMELYYLNFITVHYARFGFELNASSSKYVETKIHFALVLLMSVAVSKRSQFMYCIFVFFLVFFLVPCLITYSLSDQIAGPLYSVIALLIVLWVISSIRIKIPGVRSVLFSHGTTLVFVVLLLIPIVIKFGVQLNIRNFLLEDIAKTRAYYDAHSSTVVNYLYNWLVRAIMPIVLVFFLIRKRYGYAFISLVILLYLYIISGNKLVYITSFVVLFFFFLGRDYLEKIKIFSGALIIALVVIPSADYVLHSHNLKGIFVMRMLFLPSQLNYYYFDFFTGNPLYFAESSFFNLFFSYPFDRPIGFIISETYFNAPDMNANNGFISDGFMNLGYWGVSLNIILVSLTFLFFNSTNPDSRYLGIFFVLVFLFLSSPMLSMFVTSGLWITFLMALLIMKKERAVSLENT